MSYENNEFTSRPGAIPGRLFLCFIRKGVLMAFHGLLLLGGMLLILPPL